VSRDPTIWLVARASGIAAYALLTASVLAGVVLRSRPFGRAVKAATVTELHRTLALLGLLYLAVHGTALVLDRTVPVSPAALLVPGLGSYRPLAVSLGVVAAELMMLVYVSFRFRKRIGIKAWRALHWLTYVVFAAATSHGLAAGTDSVQPSARGLYLGAVGAVAFATAWRALVAATPARAARAKRSGTI
jgi:sulfoxide reductase heme-binding subunit YedZ